MKNFIIVTGAPGTGKTTLINLLASKNFNCNAEAARRVINYNINLDNTILPWKNRRAFDSEVLLEMLYDYYNSSKEELVFFDGGLPDILAYQEFLSLKIEEFQKLVPEFKYNKSVIILEPWEEIYVQNKVRPWTFGEILSIHSSILKVYERLNYKLTFITKDTSPEERFELLLKNFS